MVNDFIQRGIGRHHECTLVAQQIGDAPGVGDTSVVKLSDMSETSQPLQGFRPQRLLEMRNHGAPVIAVLINFHRTPALQKHCDETRMRRLDRGNVVNKTGFAGMFTSEASQLPRVMVAGRGSRVVVVVGT